MDTPPRTGASGADLVLTSADGTRFAAYEARPDDVTGHAVVVLPDNRGLHRFYADLAVRLAEQGHPAVVVDPYGRTDGVRRDRPADFDPMPHLMRLTTDGVYGDVATAVRRLRGTGAPVCCLGFCIGGRFAFTATRRTLGLGLAGAIGFYGATVPLFGRPGPTDLAGELTGPILGLFGGADDGIPPDAVADFDAALTGAGVDHETVTYPGAPHGFFDLYQRDHTAACADAWQRVLTFLS
ncbi:dienelactone hydrolase family protein [Actinocatenispora rupis]|uniref:dienelactone hydrolase family protein n=1 Tax=Actinocatenispora rupis TaxID=519421 RepID=UPI001940F983|nr:dienelactone hydrolase family protein [Actinocatenispora rupis]